MDFKFTREEEAFRKEVQAFLKREVEHAGKDWVTGFSREFALKLGAKGWLAITWPEEYGGRNATLIEALILSEELAYYRAPRGVQIIGMGWVGQSLMRYGTDEQKKKYLLDIGRGKTWVCTAYSEPGAGSDLVALQCSARAEGDNYVINGQKIFTTGAHLCDLIWLAARTDPNAPKRHHGISMFLIDLGTPGITVRPVINMLGRHEFNEVFFDDVRIPIDCLVGEENQGWYMLVGALDVERSMIEMFLMARRTLEELVALAKESGLSRDPLVRQKLAEIAIEIEVGRMLAYRLAWMQNKGITPNYESSLTKVYGTEMDQRLANAAMQILGLYGPLEPASKWVVLQGLIARDCLFSVSATIFGGTSEILRTIIATRGLGLPRY